MRLVSNLLNVVFLLVALVVCAVVAKIGFVVLAEALLVGNFLTVGFLGLLAYAFLSGKKEKVK